MRNPLFILKLFFSLSMVLLNNNAYAHSIDSKQAITTNSNSTTLLIFGDSLSMGHGLAHHESWVELLSKRLKKRNKNYTVVNASIGGDTTASGLSRLPAALKKYKPALVILELGGNDGLRGLDLAQMEKNLAAMIRLCQLNQAKILLVGIEIPPNYGPIYTKQFKAVYLKLAQRYQRQLSFLPFLLANIAGKEKYMQADGIHPNKAAQEIILQNVWQYLAPMLK